MAPVAVVRLQLCQPALYSEKFHMFYRSKFGRRMLLGALLGGLPMTAGMADDYFLTVGGGYAPSSNQASLENNVLFAQRAIQGKAQSDTNHVYFADGTDPGKDLEVMDREAVPKANRLMAEFFASDVNLGLSYRNHRVPDVRGESNPENLREWFEDLGATLSAGDRLIIYVTAHGGASRDRRNTHNTTIAMWNSTKVTMTEFIGLLDQIDGDVPVVCVMVQCHAGGFARMIFEDGDPGRGIARQNRIGVFATIHSRQAAGCTSEVDEATYEEYSTYFWAAVSGKDRAGNAIEVPDYDGNGEVSLEEAHAYTVIESNTIDLPVITSGEFLSEYGRYGNSNNESSDGNKAEFLSEEATYDEVIAVATPCQKAILERLSSQLELTGNDRIQQAERQSRNAVRSSPRGRRSRRRTPESQLRLEIARDIKKKWPQLANVMNPVAIDLVTTQQDKFIAALEGHDEYAEYRKLADTGTNDGEKKRVKYERFLRTVDNVIFAENLLRSDREGIKQKYNGIVELERQAFLKP